MCAVVHVAFNGEGRYSTKTGVKRYEPPTDRNDPVPFQPNVKYTTGKDAVATS